MLAHLDDVEERLPFALRFTLARGVPGVALFIAQALLIFGAVLRWALRRPRAGRLILSLALLLSLGTAGIGAAGLRAASRLTAYPLSPGLERCACPPLEALARECHCDSSGAVREQYFRPEDLEGTTLGDRLLYRAPSRWIRREAGPDGATFSLSDGTKLRCRYAAPCAPGASCGPCRFEPEPRVAVELGPELHCIDVRTGTRALGQGFVHLRRRIWRDRTDGRTLPSALDPADALTTTQSELIGRPGALPSGALHRILSGAGRAPPLRLGGLRECRATAKELGLLAESLEAEVDPLERLIVQVEAPLEEAE